MATHVYHPIYRVCSRCGLALQREQAAEECPVSDYEPEHPDELKQILAAVGLAVSLTTNDLGHNMRIDAVLQHFEEKVRLECRELIQQHAQSTWRGGLIERSDGITEVLVDFDQKWPRRG